MTPVEPVSRRRFLHIGAASAMAMAACAPESLDFGTPRSGRSARQSDETEQEPDAQPGRLNARPTEFRPAPAEVRRGLTRLDVDPEREALLYVPAAYEPGAPAPFVLCLHGANAGAQNGLKRLLPFADEAGLILLAPKSAGRTWDAVLGNFGQDATYIDKLLHHVFRRYRADPRRVAVQGFSDGASYALSLGIGNGDLFTHIMAFSAGFITATEPHGSPLVYVTHGTEDPVLPIDSTSRKYVPRLRRAGYDVVYEEFAGGHRTPHQLARGAVDWFVSGA